MKYIDADKIRAEIERRITDNTFGAKLELIDILAWLDTLEEPEQPTRGYDEAYLNEKIAKASKSWKGVDVDKFMDEVRGREPVSEELEEELDRFIASGESVTVDDYGTYKVSYHDFKKVARHFAEWQKEQDDKYVDTIYQQGIEKGKDDMKEQMPLPEDTLIFKKGVEEGRRLEREDMMKDAVEGEVVKTNKHTSVRYKSYYGTDRYFYGIADKQFKPGDKVRIIILPKEDGQ